MTRPPTTAAPNRPGDPFATEERRALADLAARFATEQVVPHLPSWEEAGEVPRWLHVAAADAGLLGLGFDEAVGGQGGDAVDVLVRDEALCGAGASSGLMAALLTHGIAAPHLARHGTPDQVDRWVRPMLRGGLLGALAITEPGGGSDVNNLTTRARRDGDGWVLDGSKTYITTGVRADLVVVAARTGRAGAGGISLLVVERGTPGLTVTGPLDKHGWRCSDTAELAFDGVRVPAEHLVGEEGRGFAMIGEGFVDERLAMAVQGYAVAGRCLDLAAAWCHERSTFGAPLVTRQVVRQKLVRMRQQVEAARALTRSVALDHAAGLPAVAGACMAKNLAAEVAEEVTREAVQLFGGLGFMRGTEVEMHSRDVRVLAIGGGTTEVLTDLAAKHLGYA